MKENPSRKLLLIFNDNNKTTGVMLCVNYTYKNTISIKVH